MQIYFLKCSKRFCGWLQALSKHPLTKTGCLAFVDTSDQYLYYSRLSRRDKKQNKQPEEEAISCSSAKFILQHYMTQIHRWQAYKRPHQKGMNTYITYKLMTSFCISMSMNEETVSEKLYKIGEFWGTEPTQGLPHPNNELWKIHKLFFMASSQELCRLTKGKEKKIP